MNPSSEKPENTSQNGDQVSEKTFPTTQTLCPLSEKPYQGLVKIMIIVVIVLTVVSIMLIVIIAVILVKCCVRPGRVLSAKKAQMRHDVADTVTLNDVTLTEANNLIHNIHITNHVEDADINLWSLVPRCDTDGQEKALIDASKNLVYADLAFNNKMSGRDQVPAVQQMKSLGISEDDISQLYAKPMKRNK